MTTDTTAAEATSTEATDDQEQLEEKLAPPPKLRRRPVFIAAGVAAVCLGVLLSVWAYTSTSTAESVLAMRETVTKGQTIEESDLVAVSITLDPALQVMRVGEADQVVGRQAAMDMPAGGVVTPSQLADEVLPPPGQSIVGISLTPAMLPVNEVQVGDHVRVVATPGPQAVTAPEGEGEPEPAVVEASVVGISADATTGGTVINVLVEDTQAPTVATWSAAGRAAVVIDNLEP